MRWSPTKHGVQVHHRAEHPKQVGHNVQAPVVPHQAEREHGGRFAGDGALARQALAPAREGTGAVTTRDKVAVACFLGLGGGGGRKGERREKNSGVEVLVEAFLGKVNAGGGEEGGGATAVPADGNQTRPVDDALMELSRFCCATFPV